jgi:uncharacterized protein
MTKGMPIAVDGGPLSDGERMELESFLDARIAPRGGLSIEYVDGLFAGLIAMPHTPPPSGWLPTVLGDDDQGPAFKSAEEMTRILSLLLRHWNAVARGIKGGGAYAPIVRRSPDPEEGPPGRAWARAFICAGEMAGGRAWRKFLDDRMGNIVVSPIIWLATDGEAEGKRRKAKLLTDEERSKLLAMIVDNVLPTLQVAMLPTASRKPRTGSSSIAKAGRQRRRSA